MFFLTTPNFWYPYDAHSGLYIPQLLPRFLRDRYIRRASPGFIEEHKTFDAIHLLKPGFLRSALADSALSAIHELPCCLDRDEYFRLHPVRGALAYLGLGWYFHAEFWTIVGHQEVRQKLRSKLKKNWFYQLNQPDDNPLEDFASSIDFDQGMFNHQLCSGWHWYERDKRGFRWTEEKATCYLQSRSSVQYIEISGYSPVENTIQIYVDGVRVGVHRTHSESGFDLKYLLPFPLTNDQIFKVTIESDRAIQPQDSLDKRELSLMVFSLGVTE
jgi:hypothetical protein